ncbi:hypothetical protein O181_018567 [Austropuccinia psidii MF-1]|uniref:Uncharacterized protein n=1 Tax=Austropuccinia psidii MF-1 TaxID=1389203 RepID=A0A9Q3C840_9BASI|nr:hypothetical protein [Austropuccinia psidii MF-1]
MVNKIASTAATSNAIGCMAHVLHLAAQDGLKALSKGVAPTNCKQEEPPGPMAIHDELPIYGKAHNAEKFADTVKIIHDGPKTTNENILLRHVHTCWNSTYDILEQTLCLREA